MVAKGARRGRRREREQTRHRQPTNPRKSWASSSHLCIRAGSRKSLLLDCVYLLLLVEKRDCRGLQRNLLLSSSSSTSTIQRQDRQAEIRHQERRCWSRRTTRAARISRASTPTHTRRTGIDRYRGILSARHHQFRADRDPHHEREARRRSISLHRPRTTPASLVKQLRQAGFRGADRTSRRARADTARFPASPAATTCRRISIGTEPVLIDEKVQLIADDYKKLIGRPSGRRTICSSSGSRPPAWSVKAIAKAGTISDTAKVAEGAASVAGRAIPISVPVTGSARISSASTRNCRSRSASGSWTKGKLQPTMQVEAAGGK